LLLINVAPSSFLAATFLTATAAGIKFEIRSVDVFVIQNYWGAFSTLTGVYGGLSTGMRLSSEEARN
jgi:hypothetical protein